MQHPKNVIPPWLQLWKVRQVLQFRCSANGATCYQQGVLQCKTENLNDFTWKHRSIVLAALSLWNTSFTIPVLLCRFVDLDLWKLQLALLYFMNSVWRKKCGKWLLSLALSCFCALPGQPQKPCFKTCGKLCRKGTQYMCEEISSACMWALCMEDH